MFNVAALCSLTKRKFMEPLDIFKLIKKSSKYRRRSSNPDQVVICRNGKTASVPVILGENVMRRAGFSIGDKIGASLTETGNIIITHGSQRKISKTSCGLRGTIGLPKIFNIKETLRMTPVAEYGRIELSIPQDPALVEDLTGTFKLQD